MILCLCQCTLNNPLNIKPSCRIRYTLCLRQPKPIILIPHIWLCPVVRVDNHIIAIKEIPCQGGIGDQITYCCFNPSFGLMMLVFLRTCTTFTHEGFCRRNFQEHFLEQNIGIWTTIPLRYVHLGLIDSMAALVQIMAEQATSHNLNQWWSILPYISLTLSQWSSSGNPVAIQCVWNLDPSVHWNATGEMPVCFQWSSSGFPVVFQCVPIMQINTGSPLGHHWVLASASVLPMASQCTCGSSGLPVCSNYAN